MSKTSKKRVAIWRFRQWLVRLWISAPGLLRVRALHVALLVLSTIHTAEAQSLDALSKRELATKAELEAIEKEISLSERKKEELSEEIAALDKDRATINRQLIETSARTRSLEDDIGRAASRLSELREQQADIEESLKSRRSTLMEVLAALQRMGASPPPALLVTPEDALSSVRSAILLGAVVPEIRQEAQILMTELGELQRIADDIESRRQALATSLESLAEEEERLGLLLDEKKQLTANMRDELARQTSLAAGLAGKAGSLQDLIASLGKEIEAVKQAELAARKAEEAREQKEEERLQAARGMIADSAFSDTARIAPAVSFENAKGLLPRPVSGVELVSFGRNTKAGEPAKGISIATRQGARVISPSDGWVIYAGPFRSYGQLLIVNAGDDYHIVMAGLERIDVSLGQFVLAGEPVGVMGTRRVASVSSVDIGTLRPVLYVEFRKNGTSIDPTPWWAGSNLEERS